MLETLLQFTALLRKGGLNVGLTETMDCLRALKFADFDEETFHNTLKCCMVKDYSDFMTFEKIYRLYFQALNKPAAAGLKINADNFALPIGKSHTGKGLSKSGTAGPAQELVEAIVAGNILQLQNISDKAVLELNLDSRELMPDFEEIFRELQVKLEWFMAAHLLEKLEKEGRINNDWTKRMEVLQEILRERLRHLLIEQFGQQALESALEEANTANRSFSKLQKNEIKEITREILRIARRLATRKSRRMRRSKNGIVDLRKTINNAVLSGGVPIKLSFKKKVIDKPELIILCDVSGSVAQFSEFMLQLVYAMQQRFKKVKSYVFIDWLAEVTTYFLENDADKALEKMFHEARYKNSGFSDFGKVFRQFKDRYSTSLNPRTTLIILGDAKNNWQPAREEALEFISKKCKKVIWLNPQTENEWDLEDSIMSIYRPYCHQVYSCANLNQLKQVANRIF